MDKNEQTSNSTGRISIADLPAEVVLAALLPILPLGDLFSLGKTNKRFHDLTNDPGLWRAKTLADFSYQSALTAPTESDGWFKRVYLGMRRPRAFVWGSSDNSRLGIIPPSIRAAQYVDSPLEITDSFDHGARGRTWGEALLDSLATASSSHAPTWDGSSNSSNSPSGYSTPDSSPDRASKPVSLVDLQAAGWSYAARDIRGGVWVWGQLDGTRITFRAPSWEDKHCQCPDPTRIPLPCRAESISAGRRHLLVLDADNLVWELSAWGRAFHHTSSALTAPTFPGAGSGAPGATAPAHILQLSAGWSHSACLTSNGDIHVWYPFTDAYVSACTPEHELHGPLGADEDDFSRVLRWGSVGDIIHTLDPVPRRPAWECEKGEEDDKRVELEKEWKEWEKMRTEQTRHELERVVKIASGVNFILALKSNGEVWVVKVGEEQGDWEYLPYFSSPSITHITAQFNSITAYSTPRPPATSSVLLATRICIKPGMSETLRPEPLPELRGLNVIQVVAGDFHFAALTSKGEIYTWGNNGHGQLGIANNVEVVPLRDKTQFTTGIVKVDKPAKVVFPEATADAVNNVPGARVPRTPFVFAITAAGWHTGALVLGQRTRTASSYPVVAGAGWPTRNADDDIGAFGRGRVDHTFRVGFAGRGGFGAGRRG